MDMAYIGIESSLLEDVSCKRRHLLKELLLATFVPHDYLKFPWPVFPPVCFTSKSFSDQRLFNSLELLFVNVNISSTITSHLSFFFGGFPGVVSLYHWINGSTMCSPSQASGLLESIPAILVLCGGSRLLRVEPIFYLLFGILMLLWITWSLMYRLSRVSLA